MIWSTAPRLVRLCVSLFEHGVPQSQFSIFCMDPKLIELRGELMEAQQELEDARETHEQEMQDLLEVDLDD